MWGMLRFLAPAVDYRLTSMTNDKTRARARAGVLCMVAGVVVGCRGRKSAKSVFMTDRTKKRFNVGAGARGPPGVPGICYAIPTAFL